MARENTLERRLLMNQMEASEHPVELLIKWYEEACLHECCYPEAMVLSTFSEEGVSSRVVLMKRIDMRGICFFTNYNSKKGRDLEFDSRASVNFFWKSLARQVCLKGIVKKISSQESDDYFLSRNRKSQVGAWCSKQSRFLENPFQLDEEYDICYSSLEGKEIERPFFWGGYLFEIGYAEFWKEGAYRLHDRICFQKGDSGKWLKKWLYP